MANQLAMDKIQAINHLEQAGYFERTIAERLDISRTAVRRHLGRDCPKDTIAPTGAGAKLACGPKSESECEPFREIILVKLE